MKTFAQLHISHDARGAAHEVMGVAYEARGVAWGVVPHSSTILPSHDCES